MATGIMTHLEPCLSANQSLTTRRLPYPDRVSQLSGELSAMDNSLSPPQLQKERKNGLIDSMRPLLEDVTGGEFHTFGSSENGFWTKYSDVDACLVIPGCDSKRAQMSKIYLVKKNLLMHGLAQIVVAIGAKVPIAKIIDPTTKLTVCDISINNIEGILTTLLSSTFGRIDPRVQPLGRFIKHWATSRQINDRSKGSFSTYTLLLQVFYFLQVTSPPILPLYRDIELPLPLTPSDSGGYDQTEAEYSYYNHLADPLRPPFETDVRLIQETIFKGYSQNKQNLGELIVDFFRLFGDDRFRGGKSGVTVELYDGIERANNMGVMACICPLTKKNFNPFKLKVWQPIHEEFARARDLLDAECSLEKVCEERILPPSRSAKVPKQRRLPKPRYRKVAT
eukprot:GHVS01020797.1.p1 GENE.GHVS01020797.1~~GHVS01020797.1.p1  ORF type:complete len:394 (+),score=24.63 GHVS01020797.1:391-1572(+)